MDLSLNLSLDLMLALSQATQARANRHHAGKDEGYS
jgi:hypothetical protein